MFVRYRYEPKIEYDGGIRGCEEWDLWEQAKGSVDKKS
jgi:hypothetical protein